MSTLRQSVRHRILSAVGVSGGLLAAACGSEVIVVSGGGSEGTGGAGATTGATTSGSTATSTVTSSATSGGGGFECDVPVPELATLERVCLPPSPDGSCLVDPLDELGALFNGECSDPAACWCADQIDEFCGCYRYVSEVPCGPEAVDTEPCCYFAIVPVEGFCEGRPFRVDGHVRVASCVSRADWAAPSALAVEDLDAFTRTALAEAWARDAAFEHASVASFARHVLELLAVGAPASIVRDAQQAVGDEIEHARLCYGLASRYAGAPIGPGPLDVAGGAMVVDLVAVATSVAREGCLHETVAALLAAEAAERAEVWAVRAALRQIAEDEARHAALAWRFVAWACGRSTAARDAVLSTLENAAWPAEEDAPGGIDPTLWNAHGRLTAVQQREVVAATRRDVVAPAIAALAAGAPVDSLRAVT